MLVLRCEHRGRAAVVGHAAGTDCQGKQACICVHAALSFSALVLQEAGLTKLEIDRMWGLGFLDQARLLEKRLGSVSKLRVGVWCLVFGTAVTSLRGRSSSAHKWVAKCSA